MATGNSKTLIKTEKGQTCLVKRFAISREYNFYHEYFIGIYLMRLNKRYIAPIIRKDNLNLSISYIYYPQEQQIDQEYSCEYLNIIKSIHADEDKNTRQCPLYAKESFDSVKEVLSDIESRIKKLNKTRGAKASDLSLHILQIEKVLNIINSHISDELIYSKKRFSQADSGLHNSILNNDKKLLLADLEYAGLDSPIKQCIDYLVHPKNNSNLDLNNAWLNYFLERCIHDYDKKQLNLYFSLFTLKWSLIVLNEFLPEVWKVRVHADPSRETRYASVTFNQLVKSKIYLKASQALLDNEKATGLFTESERILLSKSY